MVWRLTRIEKVGDYPDMIFAPCGGGLNDKFFSKELEDYEYPAEAIEEALHHLPKVAQQ